MQSNFGLVTKSMVLLVLLLCVGFGVLVLLNNFPTMAKGVRRGVPWCIGYQAEGFFALQAGVPI
jgi:hypothetical protein